MKLFHSTASPFVRKVMIVAQENGISEHITIIPSRVSPIARDQGVVPHNPSGHIPALLLDDGEAIYDSAVICQYLDGLDGQPLVHPADPRRRTRALCLQALADGIMNAGVLIRYETTLRPDSCRWPEWISGQDAKIRSSVAVLAAQWRSHLEGPLDIGVIAAACALSYLDFRFPGDRWRGDEPDLAAWFEMFSRRPSMVATQLKPIA